MLDIRKLNSELQAIAEKNLNEQPDKTKEILDNLRSWIDSETHLKARSDDQFLIAFLRVCHFDLDKAKNQLNIFYTLRSQMPDIIKGLIKLSFMIKLSLKIEIKKYFRQRPHKR